MTRRSAGGSPDPPERDDEIRKLGTNFPAVEITSAHTLHRAHRARNGAVYYCTNGLCRFDAPVDAPEKYGTCCTATAGVVALVEHLGGVQCVPDDWIAERRISTIRTTRTVRVADLRSRAAADRWGMRNDVQTGPDRPFTQAWGAAFRAAGFAGVRHRSRRARVIEATCVAFFGPPGCPGDDDQLESGTADMVGDDLERDLRLQYHVRIMPRRPLP